MFNSHIATARVIVQSLQGTSTRLPYPKWIAHSIFPGYELNSEPQTTENTPSNKKYGEANFLPEILDEDGNDDVADEDQFQEHSVDTVEDVLLNDTLLQYADEDEDEEARDTSALECSPGHLLIDSEPPVGHSSPSLGDR